MPLQYSEYQQLRQEQFCVKITVSLGCRSASWLIMPRHCRKGVPWVIALQQDGAGRVCSWRCFNRFTSMTRHDKNNYQALTQYEATRFPSVLGTPPLLLITVATGRGEMYGTCRLQRCLATPTNRPMRGKITAVDSPGKATR